MGWRPETRIREACHIRTALNMGNIIPINWARSSTWLRQLEVKTDLISTASDVSLRDAARILLERRSSGLPVVDENHKLLGIVSEANFLSSRGISRHHPARGLWQTFGPMFKHHHLIPAIHLPGRLIVWHNSLSPLPLTKLCTMQLIQ